MLSQIVLLVLSFLFNGLLSVHGSSVSGWTYAHTDSTCHGTDIDPCGPEYWNLLPNHQGDTCISGTSQSPINIAKATPNYKLRMPEFHMINGGCDAWVQAALNGTYEVDVHGCSNLYLVYNNEEYTLSQFHFHSPSEHSIGGGYYAAEMHMVHESATHGLLVLAVLLEVSPVDSLNPYNNTFLDQIWKAGGSGVATGEEVNYHGGGLLNPYADFLPGSPSHYYYTGSLTTPPCTEHVEWLVFADPVKISFADYLFLKSGISALPGFIGNAYGNTNRYPTQALNGRTVELYTDNTNAAEARLVTSNSSTQTVESVSIGAVVLAAVSLLITVCSLMVVCSLKAQLDSMSAKVMPV